MAQPSTVSANKFYAILPRVFAPAWCERVIARAAALHFAPAAVDIHGTLQMRTAIRNNERLQLHDEELAREIALALAGAAPSLSPDAAPGRAYAGVGADFRVYKYVPGQFFKPHRDGDTVTGDVVSLVTMLVYLNDADGGATVLMPDGFGNSASWITVQPRAGDVLLFSHAMWHEGRPVVAGEKYVLRTDLLFRLEA